MKTIQTKTFNPIYNSLFDDTLLCFFFFVFHTANLDFWIWELEKISTEYFKGEFLILKFYISWKLYPEFSLSKIKTQKKNQKRFFRCKNFKPILNSKSDETKKSSINNLHNTDDIFFCKNVIFSLFFLVCLGNVILVFTCLAWLMVVWHHIVTFFLFL